MLVTLLHWWVKRRKVKRTVETPILAYRRRGMVSHGIQAEIEEIPWGTNPYQQRASDSTDCSQVNLGGEIRGGPRAWEEDQEIEKIRRRFGERDEDEREIDELMMEWW